jgi:hypothetical protein
MTDATQATCPHCQAQLAFLELPDSSDHPFDLVCFNDECPYYVRGWAWMEQQYGVKSSYRYRMDPRNGWASPLAVWSPDAMRNCIRPDGPSAAGKEHP